MIRRPPRSTPKPSSAASDVYKRQTLYTTATPVNRCYECVFFWRGRCYWQMEVTCTPGTAGAGVVNAYGAYLAVKPSGPACSSDTDCDDGNECTDDACINPGTEDAYCENTPVADDTACSGGICCSGVCSAPACSEDTDCRDDDACTMDTCINGGTCTACLLYTSPSPRD